MDKVAVYKDWIYSGDVEKLAINVGHVENERDTNSLRGMFDKDKNMRAAVIGALAGGTVGGLASQKVLHDLRRFSAADVEGEHKFMEANHNIVKRNPGFFGVDLPDLERKIADKAERVKILKGKPSLKGRLGALALLTAGGAGLGAASGAFGSMIHGGIKGGLKETEAEKRMRAHRYSQD